MNIKIIILVSAIISGCGEGRVDSGGGQSPLAKAPTVVIDQPVVSTIQPQIENGEFQPILVGEFQPITVGEFQHGAHKPPCHEGEIEAVNLGVNPPESTCVKFEPPNG